MHSGGGGRKVLAGSFGSLGVLRAWLEFVDEGRLVTTR